jgi:hypothetical protein
MSSRQRICFRHAAFTAVLLALVLAMASAAQAQNYNVLYVYPETDRGDTGVLPPQVMAQGPDGNLYSTIATVGPTVP